MKLNLHVSNAWYLFLTLVHVVKIVRGGEGGRGGRVEGGRQSSPNGVVCKQTNQCRYI